MFSKKTCQRCGRKTKKSDSFCPNCGAPLGKNQRREDFGMLGENDSFNEIESISNSLFGGGMNLIGEGFMNKMISNTMKMLEKEMEKEMQGRGAKTQNQNNNLPKTRVKLMINGKEINLNNGMEETQNNEKRSAKTDKIQKILRRTSEKIL